MTWLSIRLNDQDLIPVCVRDQMKKKEMKKKKEHWESHQVVFLYLSPIAARLCPPGHILYQHKHCKWSLCFAFIWYSCIANHQQQKKLFSDSALWRKACKHQIKWTCQRYLIYSNHNYTLGFINRVMYGLYN